MSLETRSGVTGTPVARWWRQRTDTEKLSYVVLCVVLVVAGYLRFRRLGVAPLWIDEALMSWAARNFLAGNGFSDAVGASSPYRRAWLTTSLPIAVSFQLFGLSEFAARLPVALYSLGTVLVSWRLGTRYSRLTGLLLAAFLAVDPFTLVWAREARMYAPLAFFYLASVFVLVRWYDGGLRLRSPYPYLLAVLVFLGQNTHQAYLALGAAVVLFFAIQIGVELRSLDSITVDTLDRRTRMTGLLLVGGVFAAVGYLLVSGLPGVLTAVTPGTWPDRGPLYYWGVFGQAYPVLRLLTVPAGAYLWWRYPSGRLVVLALVVPFLVASMTPQKAPRYVYHLIPLLGLVGSVGIAATLELLWRKVTEGEEEHMSVPLRATVYTVPVLVLLVVASPVAGYAVTESVYDQPYHPGNSDWEKASEWVEKRAGEDAVIASTRPEMTMWYYGETDYFFRQHGISNAEYRDGRYVHTRTGTVFLNETEDIQRLVDDDKEVWLIAGKKFDGSFTDPAARQLVVSNFERHEEPSWVNMRVYHYDPAGWNTTATNTSTSS